MTAADWKRHAAARLKNSKDLDAETDPSLFLCAVMNCELGELRFRLGEELDEAKLKALDAMLIRREAGEPEQYIEGRAYFMGLSILVDERVLIPRQDTETLCEAAINAAKGYKTARVLDMCSGSGCIAISVKKRLPSAWVTACDISKDALEILRENARINQTEIEILQSDGFEAIKDRQFDLIACNPPYLSQSDMDTLQREVRYEPKTALFGGEDGLSFYRRFAVEMKSHLSKGGVALYEVGLGQAESVAEIFLSANENAKIYIIKDLNGVNRVVEMRV